MIRMPAYTSVGMVLSLFSVGDNDADREAFSTTGSFRLRLMANGDKYNLHLIHYITFKLTLSGR